MVYDDVATAVREAVEKIGRVRFGGDGKNPHLTAFSRAEVRGEAWFRRHCGVRMVKVGTFFFKPSAPEHRGNAGECRGTTLHVCPRCFFIQEPPPAIG
ncbi:MAG: hypothetical protein A3B37_00490 [Candidatus Sungbacteria bacterium RIFCSPLOWO2_01_FULL_59_16]|uniref:Uncharacterized protein n=1 Tax=Candidatus Sungbacteria bacterium RIFCSPLOWO2_01_FULL_59_16 TaxID=1802280 RepID=A0A1G2LB85_9BACT|nr:MAG: hypothetical protein A3B37_00490 [Candidatus Sungbacteria bacterium RIFCSPLOWO2_01_FULL_59_16]